MLRFRRIAIALSVCLLALSTPARGAQNSGHALTRRTATGAPIHPVRTDSIACGPVSMTESNSNDILAGNSVACVYTSTNITTANSYWRAFDVSSFGITNDFAVCEVVVGIEVAASGSGNGQPMTVNLYTSSPAFPGGTLTAIGTAPVTVSDQSATLLTVPVTGIVPAGSQLVVEIAIPDGQADSNEFYIGSNTAGETAPSYISAEGCGITTPTPIADLGIPDLVMDIVMAVHGSLVVAPSALAVDPPAPTLAVSGNGVLEIGENAIVMPSWSNHGAATFTLTGIASNLSGPTGPTYTITDNTADFGTIAAGATGTCSADCYAIDIEGPRPAQHFDVTMDDTVVSTSIGLIEEVSNKTWTLHVGESFTDVTTDPGDPASPYYPFIENIFHNGITVGCHSGTEFCPASSNLRQEMAVFLLRASQGSGYAPPPCTPHFNDVPCPATPDFPYSDWIEDLSARGITAGCTMDPPFNPPVYCPTADVLRQEMAVFLLRTSQGTTYTPPPCTGVFNDVPCPATPDFPYSDWIEDIHSRGITAGCTSDPPFSPPVFCPGASVLRQEMAVFLVRTFGLLLYGP